MQTFKLFQILTHFDKLEQNRIRKFISSPYFNKDKVVLTLFELMAEEINDPTNKVWTKEKIWDALAPELPYDDARLRKYQSDLLKLVEQYLIQQEFENDSFTAQAYLLRSIKKKKLKKLHNSAAKTVKELPNKISYRDGNYFLGQFILESSYEQLISNLEETKAEKTNLEEISKLLDYFYIGEKLKLICTVLSKQKFAKLEYNIDLVENIINLAEKEIFQKTPFITIYLQIYRMSSDPKNIEHYYKYKTLLTKHSNLFNEDEERELFSAGQNYCITQINLGNNDFLKEYFLLYQDIIERQLLLKDNKLESQEFRNIITVAFRLKEYEWVEKFMIKHSKFLSEDVRENVVSFSFAQLYMYQKKYDKVIQLLQKIEYADHIYNLNSKTILLITYYEIGEYEPLSNLLESMRAYINRNREIPESRKENYKNLIRFSKKLIGLTPNNKRAISSLKIEVESTKNTPSRDWLLEKITELE